MLRYNYIKDFILYIILMCVFLTLINHIVFLFLIQFFLRTFAVIIRLFLIINRII